MALFEKVIKKLEELSIPYQLVEHEPAFTTEQADRFIEGIEGVRTKTMFLTNRKKTAFYLIIMDGAKRLNMNRFQEITSEKRVKMASERDLHEKMMLPPGTVSPFGLLNNTEKDIHVYFDKDIMGEKRMSFHPNTNEKTIFVDTSDLLRFIRDAGYVENIVEL
ncbi:MAG TPA: prolyl-tRNA synthetase associated domain-containing protein [Tissierellia bacterium]|nr:prolyl-tRNA synthetase associated domain-containing protein [Tissierellia bacterium]